MQGLVQTGCKEVATSARIRTTPLAAQSHRSLCPVPLPSPPAKALTPGLLSGDTLQAECLPEPASWAPQPVTAGIYEEFLPNVRLGGLTNLSKVTVFKWFLRVWTQDLNSDLMAKPVLRPCECDPLTTSLGNGGKEQKSWI